MQQLASTVVNSGSSSSPGARAPVTPGTGTWSPEVQSALDKLRRIHQERNVYAEDLRRLWQAGGTVEGTVEKALRELSARFR
jgi:hypothetical protein